MINFHDWREEMYFDFGEKKNISIFYNRYVISYMKLYNPVFANTAVVSILVWCGLCSTAYKRFMDYLMPKSV